MNQNLSGDQFRGRVLADLITNARDAGREMTNHPYEGGCSPGGCGTAAAVVWDALTRAGVPSRIEEGVILNNDDQYVAAGPDYWHARTPHREDYQNRPREVYSRADLDALGEDVHGTVGSHLWVRREDTGDVIDPTADQFGRGNPLFSRAGTPANNRYYRFPQ